MTANCFDDFVVAQYNSFRIQFESSFKSTEYYEFPLRKSYETFFPFSLSTQIVFLLIFCLRPFYWRGWLLGSKIRIERQKNTMKRTKAKKSYGNILLSSVFFSDSQCKVCWVRWWKHFCLLSSRNHRHSENYKSINKVAQPDNRLHIFSMPKGGERKRMDFSLFFKLLIVSSLTFSECESSKLQLFLTKL